VVAFNGEAWFQNARFAGDVWIGQTTFGSTAWFEQARFEKASVLGFTGGCIFFVRTQFPAGVTVRARAADFTLEGARFGAPSVIAAAPPPSEPDLKNGQVRQTGPPRLTTIDRTDVSSLTLVGLDLQACLFGDVYQLDMLRLQGLNRFARTPSGWRWTDREVIAEERVWQASYAPDRRRDGWATPPDPQGADAPQSRLEPEQRAEWAREIASTYRALRKALEDSKDEPGAADFYYGEMEMRRAAATRWWERAILTAYWAAAGYGLRASRAVATLTVIVLLAAVGFLTIGFGHTTTSRWRPVGVDQATGAPVYATQSVRGPRPGWKTAAEFSAESAASLLRPPQLQQPLTGWGETFHLSLRLLGPGLLGLAVLGIRNRVKR